LESTATAAGFALLVSLALKSLNAYPTNWIVVIGIAIGLLGIRWPLLAYVIGAAAMCYPLYAINLYLAVLFIAVAALGHRIMVHYLGATALVLATPLLAEYHLHWLAPILGGLWWGGLAGAWIGGMAAIWGKVVGGMSGLNIDWLVLAGQSPTTEAIAARFHDANSLDTLLLLVEPFAATSTVILYNLLQVAGWIVAGGFVGTFAARKWVKYHAPWSIMVVTAGGGLILLLTHIGLPFWLTEAVPEAVLAANDPAAPLFSLMVVIVVGTVVYSLRESLDLPVAPPRKPRRVVKQPGLGLFNRRPKPANAAGAQFNAEFDQPRKPVRVPSQSELPEWEPPQNDGGLIMLEID
jgi:hypothetical protein